MTRRKLTPRPDPMPLSECLLSNCVQGPLTIFFTAFFGSLAWLASLFNSDGSIQHRLAQTWAKVLVRVFDSPLTVVGGENLRKHAVAVYACNHLSFTDTPMIFSALPFQFRIVARHDLWNLPFIGGYMKRSGQVPVNVDNPRASLSSLGRAAKTLEKGMPVFIFPEGGRTEDGHLAPFLNGPAFMAIRARVPIVPMALIGTYELMPINTRHLHPEPVTLIVGEPIETGSYSMKQVNELTARLRSEISHLYYRHSYLESAESESAPA